MNFIFISPHYPGNYFHFCAELKANGVNVLGIGDAAYDSLPYVLRNVLTEYYRVDSMESYDQMMRAVAYFTFKYGKIDWLESNNEYWLELDARLRTDFNISTGYQAEEIKKLKSKAGMKQYYRQAGIPCADYCLPENREQALDFAARHGYPLVAKPDRGAGAGNTHKVENEADLLKIFDRPDITFILEPFVKGIVCSYDAIAGSRGEPLFESGHVAPVSAMEVVSRRADAVFYIEKELPADIREAGRLCLKTFNIKSRFVHLEFIRLSEDTEGLGKAGDLVGLEANLRPSGGYSPDMLNYANSTDVYKIWADMIAFDRSTRFEQFDHYYCLFVGRRDSNEHANSHNDVLSRYRADIMMSDRLSPQMSAAMGDQMYIARFAEKEQMEEFQAFALA